ncbi:MAG: PepSY-associated TM helix domain-containing protein [Acidobacteriota bacterium]|nr:PepSY-associated TM helix domain-containing protein [Acidobacteriota bacterium]MDQ7087133.1 PepSY-associated TM helix domain-containing protein [Acidobacteriota bacterium]
MKNEDRRRQGFSWRRWNNILHRDLGYFCVALTIIYAVSGIAVNHVHQWNPNYTFERITRPFDPVPVADRETMVAALVEALGLPGPPVRSFRPAPETVMLFYDGWSVEAHAEEGRAVIERPRERWLLRDMNFLHLNHGKGLWTWFADAYAAVLLLLAITGMFVLRGRKGLAGRGKWFVLAGFVVPIVFLLFQRYL